MKLCASVLRFLLISVDGVKGDKNCSSLLRVLEEPKKRGSYGSDSNNPFGMWKVRLLLVVTIYLLDLNTSMIFEFLLGF